VITVDALQTGKTIVRKPGTDSAWIQMTVLEQTAMEHKKKLKDVHRQNVKVRKIKHF